LEIIMETTTLNIRGMTCGGCVASVSRVLKAVPGVTDVVVALEPGTARVTFDPARTAKATLAAAVEEAGFDVAG
jgi:copper chaperone